MEYPGIEIARTSPEEYESTELFQLLVEAVSDYAIFMLDPDGYIRSWNTGAQRNKGYMASDIIGQHFSIFYTPDDRLSNRPERLLLLAATEGRIEDEGWRMRKDGTRFWADVIVTPLFTPDRKLRGFAKITRDVTEKREILSRMEEALNASKAKSAFLANMSHELRTPLNAILGYAELLGEQFQESNPEAFKDVEKILYSGRHLLSIIRDVLDLSKIEAGHLEINNESVDVLDLIRGVVDTTRPLAERNCNETTVSSTSPVVKAECDPVRLRQVIYNIYSNACKFSKDGKIEIRVNSFGGEVEIRITDTGIGMSESQVHQIFDKFYQVETASAPANQSGTGLGLAISQLLCKAMGGSISATSEPGNGSTFSIRLEASSTQRLDF